MLKRTRPADLQPFSQPATDPETLSGAAAIVTDVREGGEQALRRYAEKLDGLGADAPLLLPRHALDAALEAVGAETRELLERTAGRIRIFADAQRASMTDVTVPVPGGNAGQEVVPVSRAGCYAPGGRFPLPSSVLMTAVTARAAGVPEVWVASPSPTPVTLAAASVAGADGFLCAGGAQAVAALAYGVDGLSPADVVVGPGNRWVTAAKRIVSGDVGIDMLAGPSELVVIADDTADPETIAADLLAQAEHDPDAGVVLLSTSEALADAVDTALEAQCAVLPTRAVAKVSVRRGHAVVCADLAEAAQLSNRLAPEHLEVVCQDAEAIVPALLHYGALFVGCGSAEVFGDYGIGPNHTLPTGGGARFSGGLSVFDFLRVRTWLRTDTACPEMAADAATLARLEGLEAHARSADRRR